MAAGLDPPKKAKEGDTGRKTHSHMHIGTPEIILIALVVLLLFGGKKIPELMRGLGKGVRSFRDGLNSQDGDDKKGNGEER